MKKDDQARLLELVLRHTLVSEPGHDPNVGPLAYGGISALCHPMQLTQLGYALVNPERRVAINLATLGDQRSSRSKRVAREIARIIFRNKDLLAAVESRFPKRVYTALGWGRIRKFNDLLKIIVRKDPHDHTSVKFNTRINEEGISAISMFAAFLELGAFLDLWWESDSGPQADLQWLTGQPKLVFGTSDPDKEESPLVAAIVKTTFVNQSRTMHRL